jgi:predicted acylesterase/phospholipase RssA
MSAKRAQPPGYLPAFCLHFLLPNTLLIVLALAVGALGGEYGIPYLIWHDDPMKQFWVGFGLALVALQALYIGFLLWGKKAGRPDQLLRFPYLAERVNSCLFGKYCAWVVGQLSVLVIVLTSLVLLVQAVDSNALPVAPNAVAEEKLYIPPPRPNYGPWLPLGALAATTCIFVGGFLAKFLIQHLSTPSAPGAPRKLMAWLIDSTEDLPPTPPKAGIVLALWSARTHGSRLRRLWVAVFNQTLCLSVGVVFAAMWDLSRFSVAIGVSATMLFCLVAVRAKWLNDTRVFRAFLLVLGCLSYFVVTWLGSRPWCGWPGAFAVTVFLLTVIPVGARYAFPTPSARLLRRTNERIIDPSLCRRYPFHSVAILFFFFGVLTLFVLPMASEDVRSPMILGCFLGFMFLALYGFVAYAIDDALPYLAPALIAMVVLSGMPNYKMQFPGLEYRGKSEDGTPAALLDLQEAVDNDVARKKEFDEALARSMTARNVALMAGGAARAAEPQPNGDVARKWEELEQENRILPGKDNRPGMGHPNPGRLLTLPEVAFTSVPDRIGADPTPGKKKPMVVVVASGGGIRAAAWTFLVLSELEARFAAEGIPFPYHVRIITGASGGMFGASYYVRSLKAPNEMQWGADRRDEMGDRLEKLTQDWLTPVVQSMVTNDVPAFFSPFPSPTDRGVALEKAWSKGLDRELDMSFEQLGERERAGWCPSLVFSPMMIEDGRRLLISNLDMRYPASNDGHLLGQDDTPTALADLNKNYSHEAMELFRMFPQSRNKFAISTAVRMSASFPFLSPAVALPTKPRRRVVDAGYFDNYGVSLAASFLFSKKNNEWFKDNVSKIVILQIRDGQSEDERRLEQIPDARRQKGIDSLLSRSLEEFTSPIEGLNNGRVGTCSFRNDGLLELLSTYYVQMRQEPGTGKLPHARRFFTVVNFEYPGHVALSWHLSKGEKSQMRATFTDSERSKDLKVKIDALLDWWKTDAYEPPPPIDELRAKVRIAGAVK